MDIATYALAKKYVNESLKGAGALKGEKGDPGKAFTYDDFTPEQLAALKGPKGDAFTFDDFTSEQLQSLKGEKGDALTFNDLTQEEKQELKGDPGKAFTYDDFTPEQLAALKGPKGDALTFNDLTQDEKEELRGPQGNDYVITSKDYSEIAKQVDVPKKTSELVNDSNFLTENAVSDVKVNGKSILQNGVADISLGDIDTTIGEQIVSGAAVGGVPAGTTFPADTSVADIIKKILNVSVDETKPLYVGASKVKPTSLAGLKPVSGVTKQTLLSDAGYVYKNILTNDEYVVLALPKAFGVTCYTIIVNGFGIGFAYNEDADYYYYYDDTPSTFETPQRYTYKFEEA